MYYIAIPQRISGVLALTSVNPNNFEIDQSFAVIHTLVANKTVLDLHLDSSRDQNTKRLGHTVGVRVSSIDGHLLWQSVHY